MTQFVRVEMHCIYLPPGQSLHLPSTESREPVHSLFSYLNFSHRLPFLHLGESDESIISTVGWRTITLLHFSPGAHLRPLLTCSHGPTPEVSSCSP
jgi:hypothetical protein